MTRLHRTNNTIPSFILFSPSTCSISGQSVFADAAHKFQRQVWHVLKKMSHLRRTGLGLAKSWNQEGFDTFHNKLLIDDSGSDRRLVLSENLSFQQKHVKWNCKTQNMHQEGLILSTFRGPPIKIHSFAVTLPTLAQWHFVSTDYPSPYALWQASITSWNHTVGNQMCIITVFRFTFFSSAHTILHLVFFISGNFVLALFSEPAKQNKQHFNSTIDISLNHLWLFCFHFNPRCKIKIMNLTSLNTDKSVLYLGL